MVEHFLAHWGNY